MTHLPAAYKLWQVRLFAEFFADREGEPVVVFIDRDVLNKLADRDDGAGELATAVREIVEVSRGHAMFTRVNVSRTAWRHGARAEPPPTLPILALSVLAASEMVRSGQIASNNYYVPLARVMLPGMNEDTVLALRDVLRDRGAFAHVVAMWKELHAWLVEKRGKYGLSTIREHPSLTRIGYPLSQTLIRRSDRATLTHFFDRLEVQDGGVPSESSLFSLLQLWVSLRPHGLSERFITALNEPTLADIVRDIVHDLANAWDGKVVTREGLRRLEIRLALDLTRGESWWVIPSVPDIDEEFLHYELNGSSYDSVLLRRDPYSSLYLTEGMPSVDPDSLSKGLTLRGKNSVATFSPTDLAVLVDDPDAGGAMTVGGFQPYEEHTIVVAVDIVDAIETLLAAAARKGWKRVPQPVSDRRFHGFAIYYRVVFTNEELLESAISLMPTNIATKFRKSESIRPRLVNGLPIMPSMGRNIYITGGEPDIALPVGAEQRKVLLEIDDLSDRISASIFPFPINRLGSWEIGKHRVRAEGEELIFYVRSDSIDTRQSAQTHSIGWVDGSITLTSGTVDICGALCAAADCEAPLIARRGAWKAWLIMATGRAIEFHEPSQPVGIDGIVFPMYEVRHPEAVWFVQERRFGWSIDRMRFREPNFRDLSEVDQRIWEELYDKEINDPIWRIYRNAWARYRER